MLYLPKLVPVLVFLREFFMTFTAIYLNPQRFMKQDFHSMRAMRSKPSMRILSPR
jgi:hypothetical protein